MGGASFAFNPDELFTRAKNQSSTPTAGCVSHRQPRHNILRDTCSQMGAEIKAVSWAPQVHLPSAVQIVYIQ